MQLFLIIALLVILTLVTYQDFKHRAVYWILFPVLALGSILVADWNEFTFISWGINTIFISFQLGVLWLYFFTKEKKAYNYINKYLGLGDVLFMVVLIFWFTPINFIIFFITSLSISLLYILLFQRKVLSSYKTPLAGIQASLLGSLIILDQTSSFDIFWSDWVLTS